MKTHHQLLTTVCWICFSILISVYSLCAVEEREIRRALPHSPVPSASEVPISPVTNPTHFDDRPIRRATPIDGRIGGLATKSGNPSAESAATTLSESISHSTTSSSSTPISTATPTNNPPDDSQTIRLRPWGADSDAAVAKAQLDGANSLYIKKIYDMAILEYEKFLGSYPKGEGRDAALFRLAESHRFLGHREAARNGYYRLIQEFPSGAFTAAAAYRLGEIFYSAQNYFGALTQFHLAAQNAKEEGVRLSALFYEARCLEILSYKAKALAIYKQLVAIQKDNPFYDYSVMAVAQDDVDTENHQAALDKFDQVAKSAQDLAVRVEANVRGATVALAIKQWESAIRRFNAAIEIPTTAVPEWKSTAWLGLLQLYYQTGEYNRVITDGEKALTALSQAARAEGLLLIANSYRQLNNFKEAAQIYNQLIQEFPRSKEADEALFQRLVALFSLGETNLLEEINAFEKQSMNPLRRSQLALLKAEVFFLKKQFAEAIPLFQEVQKSELSDSLKADSLYKLGWCYAHNNSIKEAILAYSQFIKTYPENPLISSALLQRGIAQQQNKEITAALNDYDTLIAQFPNARERESALLQRALLLGAKDDKLGMIQTFQQLLSEYPKSVAVAQANFWMGWAAYENKDYKNAIEYLNKARTLDKANYEERASLRILIAYYYLKDFEATSRESASTKSENIPAEILRWLGLESFRLDRLADAERYLSLYLKSADPSQSTSSEISLSLAEIQLKLKKYPVALATIENYLNVANDPNSRAQGLFIKAQILGEEGKIEDAIKLIHQVQLLQPEGAPNARARLMAADLQMVKHDYPTAARDYMSVALLYDDPQLAPQALKRAAQAYRQANNSLDEQRALAQLKKRFPSEPPP